MDSSLAVLRSSLKAMVGVNLLVLLRQFGIYTHTHGKSIVEIVKGQGYVMELNSHLNFFNLSLIFSNDSVSLLCLTFEFEV